MLGLLANKNCRHTSVCELWWWSAKKNKENYKIFAQSCQDMDFIPQFVVGAGFFLC